MSTIEDLNNLLNKLSQLRSDITEESESLIEETRKLTEPLQSRQDNLRAMKEDYESIRQDVLVNLRQNKMKTWKNDKVTAFIKPSLKIRMTDPSKVQKWLLNNDLEPEEYMTPRELDSKRVVHLQESLIKETGEKIPGVEVQSVDILSVRDAK